MQTRMVKISKQIHSRLEPVDPSSAFPELLDPSENQTNPFGVGLEVPCFIKGGDNFLKLSLNMSSSVQLIIHDHS